MIMSDSFYKSHIEYPIANLQGLITQIEEVDKMVRGSWDSVDRAITDVRNYEANVDAQKFGELVKK